MGRNLCNTTTMEDQMKDWKNRFKNLGDNFATQLFNNLTSEVAWRRPSFINFSRGGNGGK
jgi:hypothetical protein